MFVFWHKIAEKLLFISPKCDLFYRWLRQIKDTSRVSKCEISEDQSTVVKTKSSAAIAIVHKVD